jgi:hypothetical protein
MGDVRAQAAKAAREWATEDARINGGIVPQHAVLGIQIGYELGHAAGVEAGETVFTEAMTDRGHFCEEIEILRSMYRAALARGTSKTTDYASEMLRQMNAPSEWTIGTGVAEEKGEEG